MQGVFFTDSIHHSLPSAKIITLSQTTQTPHGSQNRHSHRGAIIGGLIGGIVFIVFLVSLIFWRRRRHRKSEELPVIEAFVEQPKDIDNDHSVHAPQQSTVIPEMTDQLGHTLRGLQADLANLRRTMMGSLQGDRDGAEAPPPSYITS